MIESNNPYTELQAYRKVFAHLDKGTLTKLINALDRAIKELER